MPELPEVETVVRSLRGRLVGARLESFWWSRLPLRLGRAPDVAAIRRVSVGAWVAAVRRRGKYLILDLADERRPSRSRGGARETAGKTAREGQPARGAVVVHLGMTGRLQLTAADAPRAAHTHLVWKLEGAAGRLDLRFVDPRRFGWVGAARDLATVPELALLGPDPLTELEPAALVEALAASRAPIKSFLLDQRRIAGLGNIYVCEAMFRARVSPVTPAFRAGARAAALYDAIRAVLQQGIANRGTTLRDYVDADGFPGENSMALQVYGREGQPCVVCRAAIVRRVDSARSTFYCPRCQR
jgi:formamidopyrimidine-DNA glycosylase